MGPNAPTELSRAVDISNRIQTITRQAFEMQLQATNAIILTRSRGVRVPGFDAVAQQMGELSRDLAREIAPLRSATAGWIRAVSAQLGDLRALAMLEAARDATPHQQLAVEAVLRPLREQIEQRTDIERERRAFARVVDDVRSTVATGCVLARTAKIEAAYGAELRDVLGATAQIFTTLADTIDESVRTITRAIGATRIAA